MMITALIYGESPIRITEKFSRPQPKSDEKNDKPLWPWTSAEIPSVFTPGIGITERNL